MRGAHRRCARLYGDGGWRGKFLRIPYELHRCGAIHRRQPKSGPQELGSWTRIASPRKTTDFTYLAVRMEPGRPGELELVMAANGTSAFPEAFTFDDVLLKPGLSEVLPSEVDIRTRSPGRSRSTCRSSPPRWTPSPRRRWRSPWRRPAASASSTATSSPTCRPRRSARSRNSSPAWWSIRSPSVPMRRWPTRWR